MKNIKQPLSDIQWLKIGYVSWLYYLARHVICHNKKKITFQWNIPMFNFFLGLQKDLKRF